MAKASAKPMKIRSGEWGIRVVGHEEELQRGSVVKIYTRESDYLAIIRNLVFSGHDRHEDATVSLYGVNRVPDDRICQICGTKMEIDDKEIFDFGRPVWREGNNEGTQENRSNVRSGFKKRRPESNGNGEALLPQKSDPDDEIPF